MSDSCDENEENQRNETVENNMSGQGNYTNNHFDNSRNGMSISTNDFFL